MEWHEWITPLTIVGGIAVSIFTVGKYFGRTDKVVESVGCDIRQVSRDLQDYVKENKQEHKEMFKGLDAVGQRVAAVEATVKATVREAVQEAQNGSSRK